MYKRQTFAFAACALYWSKWPDTGKVALLTLVAAPVAAVVLRRRGETDLRKQFAPAWWLVGFLVWMSAVSALGSPDFGGHGVIPGGLDIALVALSAVAFYFWAVRAGVRAHETGLTGDDPALDTGSDSPATSAVVPEDNRPMASV